MYNKQVASHPVVEELAQKFLKAVKLLPQLELP
jgi:hypothetical protein